VSYRADSELAESTMAAVMGREAVYTGTVVTWEEMMASELSLAPEDFARWDGSLRPRHKPGMPRV